MKTQSTSNNLLVELSKKLENLKISDLTNFNQIVLKSDEQNKIEKVIKNHFLFYESSENSKLDFFIATTTLSYDEDGFLTTNERIQLSPLNYDEIFKWDSLMDTQMGKKINLMLLVWYQKKVNWKNSKIIKSKLIQISEQKKLIDILENDYQIIRNKIFLGKVHELSEGDTKYLGVIRNEKPIKKPELEQPYSQHKTYQRMFVLKHAFMEILYNDNMEKNTNNILQIESNIKNSVLNYKNKSVSFLMEEFQINKLYPKIKEDIFFKILNVGSSTEFNNEEKTNFNFFTITLNSKNEINNKVKINFNLAKQLNTNQPWENSPALKEIEKTCYVLIYQESENNKLNPKIVDIKKVNFSDETLNYLKNEFKKFKKDTKTSSSKSKLKEKFLYLDNDILKSELRDF